MDPMGGSFHVEQLTDRIEAEAEALIAEIDKLGGMVAAIESGYVSRLVDQAGYEWCMQIERRERIVVGVNEYADSDPPRIPLFSVGEDVRRLAIERLNQVKARRDGAAVTRSLAALKQAAGR